MKNLSELSTELDHGHLVIARDKKAQAIIAKGALFIVAELWADGVYLSLMERETGYPISSLHLPMAAFDEILELIICAG